jgi:hypothetical protein
MSQRKASKHKHTVFCPIGGCNYTSRQWVILSKFKLSHKESVYSTKCPKHQTVLISETKE